MKKLFLMLLCAALMLASAALAEAGATAPDFTVTTCEGETVSLAALLADKDLVVLNIFTSWCPPCRMEFPEMETVYEELSDRMEIVAVSDEPNDTDQIIANYKAELGLTFPMGTATGTGIIEFVQPVGYPTTLFIDKSGTVGYTQVGMFLLGSQFRAMADWFLAEDYDGTPATAYNVYVCDQDENPVPGAYLNFCTDTTCETKVSDEDGTICFVGKPENYHLQMLKLPEGYSASEDSDQYFDGSDGEWLFVHVNRD